MCIDAANCSGTCSECMSDKIRRLTMANKQLTKMCDQYLAELAAERRHARLPEALIGRIRERLLLSLSWKSAGAWTYSEQEANLLSDILEWHEQQGGRSDE